MYVSYTNFTSSRLILDSFQSQNRFIPLHILLLSLSIHLVDLNQVKKMIALKNI